MTTHSPSGTPAGNRAGAAVYGRIERLSLTAGALIMLVIVGASLVIAARSDADLAGVERMQKIRALSVDLVRSLTLAESGQRGYLLTGNSDYRVPYDQAAREVPDLLNQIEALLPGDADLRAWRLIISAKLNELAQTVGLQDSGRHDEAIALVMTDRGKRDMDQAIAIGTRLIARERDVVTEDLRRSQLGTRVLVVVDSLGFIVLAALVVLVSRSLGSTFRRLRESERELRKANLALEAGRNQLEEAVAERTAELSNANEEIQRFAYIVSHDLRAPLLNIIGFTGELENATGRLNRFVSDNLEIAGIAVPPEVREASQEDLPEAIRFIRTSTAKMDRLITAILRLSREGRRVLTPDRVDMKALLSTIVDSLRHQADEQGAEITLGDVPAIVSDRLALEQVFSNVIENALKYCAPGRPVRIDIAGNCDGRLARFAVRDNGRGIAPRDLERVFELFRRAGTQDTPGEGIGLAHVRTLVRRLGGNIDCQSTPDVGSVFTITLPVKLAHHGETRA